MQNGIEATIAHEEWQAWQRVAQLWRTRTAADINDSSNDALVAAIQLWGERLVQLRQHQSPVISRAALLSAIERTKPRNKPRKENDQ